MKMKIFGLLLMATIGLQGQTAQPVFVDATKQSAIRFDHCMGTGKLAALVSKYNL